MSGASVRWADLRTRLISALVMGAVGAVEIWLGGVSFTILVILLTAAMIWELAKMTAPNAGLATGPGFGLASGWTPLVLAAIAAVSLSICLLSPRELGGAFLLVPALAFALTPRRDRRLSAALATVMLVAGYGLIALRDDAGASAILWVVAVVVTSDVLGYFVGRLVGGPKFWPTISPKKTWSGTVAGWVGAVGVGAVFLAMGHSDWTILILSPFIAFAGQMGDIGESWIKRRSDVKDSSNLIPGHGGVMDRFDAMTGAVAALMLLDLLLTLSLPLAAG